MRQSRIKTHTLLQYPRLTVKFNFAGITYFGNSHFERGRWNLVATKLHWNDIAADTLWGVSHRVDTIAVVNHFRAHTMTGWILIMNVNNTTYSAQNRRYHQELC